MEAERRRQRATNFLLTSLLPVVGHAPPSSPTSAALTAPTSRMPRRGALVAPALLPQTDGRGRRATVWCARKWQGSLPTSSLPFPLPWDRVPSDQTPKVSASAGNHNNAEAIRREPRSLCETTPANEHLRRMVASTTKSITTRHQRAAEAFCKPAAWQCIPSPSRSAVQSPQDSEHSVCEHFDVTAVVLTTLRPSTPLVTLVGSQGSRQRRSLKRSKPLLLQQACDRQRIPHWSIASYSVSQTVGMSTTNTSVMRPNPLLSSQCHITGSYHFSFPKIGSHDDHES